MGPTGSGKTKLAISLFKELPVDIVSVDSVQVYKYLNIGSGKPALEVLQKYPHKLIDKLELHETYSAGLFRDDAMEEISNSIKSRNYPILVGGTMLYFRSLVQGLSVLPSADDSIRQFISKEAKAKGWPYLHMRLSKIDPKSAKKIHPNDSQRIQRALEVYELSKKTITDLHEDKHKMKNSISNEFNILQFAIKPESKDIQRKVILARFESMLDDGLIEEVKRLLALKNVNSTLSPLKSVGYRQVCKYLEGFFSYDEMVYRALIATRQLAKRQMTWLTRWKDITWLSQDIQSSLSLVTKKIENTK